MMRALIKYHAEKELQISKINSFTAPKTDSFPYWTFWSTNESNEDLVDVHFCHIEGVKSVSVFGGEKL